MILNRHLYMSPEESDTAGTGEGGDPHLLSSEVTATTTVLDTKPYDYTGDIHPEVKDDPVWKSVPDVKTLTKAYADAVKYNVGAIKMPGKDATAQDWDTFHKKLGRPESAEGYTLAETLKDDPTAVNMRAVAHSAGLTPTQWEKLSEGWSRINGESAKQQAASRDATVSTLQGEWGAAYDRKIGLVQRLIRTYGGEETFQKLSTDPIGNDVGYIKLMATVAEAMAEEELIGGEVEGVVTKEAAQAELDTLTLSKAYLNPRESGHAAAVKRATQLFEIVFN